MPERAMLRRAVVCVPVRNEAEALPRLIRSLNGQDGLGGDTRLRLVILANNCTDETVEIVGRMGRDGEIAGLDLRLIEASLPPRDAHVGTARRMALDAGADWLEADGMADGALLSADADAVAPPGWALAILRALEGAEAVGGRLVIDSVAATPDPALSALHATIERYWAGVRALEDAIDPPAHDPAPRHGDHVAASLALRADLYRRVGGLPPLPCGEDNALVAAIRAQGGRVRHCPAVSILVSDRGAGRVQGGMATEMARRIRVTRGEEAYLLPPARHWRGLIERGRALRLAWEAGDGRDAALAALGVGPGDLSAIDAPACPNAIAFVERMSARLGEAGPEPEPEPLDAALDGIAATLRELGRARGA